LEIHKLFPDITVSGVACPLWAALVEAGEADSPGADYFVQKRITQLMQKDASIDTIILGCTHYPLLLNSILKHTPRGVKIMPQGEYVADSLRQYLSNHPEMEQRLTKGGQVNYLTTENPDRFKEVAQVFLHESVDVKNVSPE